MKPSSHFIVFSVVIVIGNSQRSPYAGRRPIGYPLIQTSTSVNGLANKFGENENVTTQRLPIEALGDRELVNRLGQYPQDKQPFWLLNWQALEEHRKRQQTYNVRPSIFANPTIPQNTPTNQDSALNNINGQNLQQRPDKQFDQNLQQSLRPNNQIDQDLQQNLSPNGEISQNLQQNLKPNDQIVQSLQQKDNPNGEIGQNLQQNLRPNENGQNLLQNKSSNSENLQQNSSNQKPELNDGKGQNVLPNSTSNAQNEQNGLNVKPSEPNVQNSQQNLRTNLPSNENQSIQINPTPPQVLQASWTIAANI